MKNKLAGVFDTYLTSFSNIPTFCWIGILLSFLNSTSGGIIFFLSLYFVKTLNFNIISASVIISCYGLGRVLGGICTGKLSDKASPILISSSCLLIKSLAFFILIGLNNFVGLMFLLFIIGVVTYGFKTSNNFLVLQQCNNHVNDRLKAVSLLYTGSNLGIAFAAIIVTIFTRQNFQYLFATVACILLLATIYYYSAQRHVKFKKSPETPQINSTSSRPLRKKNMFIIYICLICVFFIGLIISQLSTTYTIYLHNAFPELGIRAAGILLIINCLLIALIQTPTVNSLASYNKVFIMGIGACLAGSGMLLLSFSFTFSIAIISVIIYTFGEMIFIPVAQLLCYQYSERNKKGFHLGIYQSTYAASLTAGPILGGWIYHTYSGNMVWYLSGLLGLVCFLLCYFNKSLITFSSEC